MRVIVKPEEDPKDVFLTCISHVANKSLKDKLSSVVDNVNKAAEEFNRNGMDKSFYRLNEHDNIAKKVTENEMVLVYTNRMAKKGAPGRSVYDKLKASAPQGICPLCGQRTVSTLDHYLPKARFPLLVVVPFNLVPACYDCNKLKRSTVPTTTEEQTLHPYYDDVTSVQWLFAEVVKGPPVSISFFVKDVDDWSDAMNARIKQHFNIYGLGSLYTSQAGAELANIRCQLKNILVKSNSEDVRDQLLDAFKTRNNNHRNSWGTAMYKAMADNEWFCNGGFKAK
ncbi:conserved hypothetical protein [Bathymodiolus platifrons methanotrophic gill symbiont]|uniref:HNH endonuclease n=1 Tax=Bathymodiolus platifrons methanotrophic gill symbiont TaxID=113268 RepID=UPI000B408582|nr:hypothetical protein [Bathymodiolus platifrons methanotrophic gill symbiont]GAW86881.1 conserved hypothetical protein [Bathymodiolus platifrons methanotrophic gill symbiont]GFO77766.1 hypothetical protein BPLS_P6401 [Bathymodiolus platifrons methanotrophic gill symbiont]